MLHPKATQCIVLNVTKIYQLLAIFPILIALSVIILYRQFYIHPFNTTFLENLYNHSQWVIPQSTTQIGDDGLYQYAAYVILHTGDVFRVNPQVPPLGKYLYSLSLAIFNNVYIVLIFLYLTTAWLFYYLSGFFFSNRATKLIAVSMLLLNPLYSSQAGITLLDLPQLFWLMLHIIFLYKLKDKGSLTYAVLSGIALGGFYSTKIGILVAAIILADIYFLYRVRRLALLLYIAASSFIFYVLLYLPYFLQGHSIIEWIKSEKWVVNFYKNSEGQASFFLSFVTLLTGFYKGWWGASWERAKEWNLLYPLGFIALIGNYNGFFKKFFSFDIYLGYLVVFLSVLLLIYAFIPFWTRYLLLALPFLITLLVKAIKSRPLLMLLLAAFLVEFLLYFVQNSYVLTPFY